MKPNHTNFHRLLLYLLGELPPEEKKNVDKHLRTCRQCEKLMEEGKTLLRLMRQHTQPEPSDPLLEECRTHLRERIREESVRKTRQRLWTNIWDHIPFQIPTKQLVTATVLFLFGLILGRFLPNGGGPSQDAVRALQSSIPVGSFRVIPTEGQSDHPPQLPVRRGALVVISQPMGADVYIDDRHMGTTPLAMKDVPTGSYRVEMELEYCRIWHGSVNVPNRQMAEVRVEMEPQPGALEVSSEPAGAKVLVDGKEVGATPYNGWV